MKKIVSVIAAVLLIVCLSAAAFAADSGSVAVSSTEGNAGDTVTVTISLTGNPGVAYLGFPISYDETRLEAPAITEGGLSGWQTTLTPMWYSADNRTYTGVILNLSFKIKEDAPAGKASVSIGAVEAWTADDESVTINASSGGVMVKTAATPVPVTPTPTPTATPVPVTPTPAPTATPVPVTPTPTPTVTPVPATPAPAATATPKPVTPTPTATATPKPVTPAPTATATPKPVTPTPTATATPKPVTPTPTATATPVPVTPTPTATATPKPVTPTPTATATLTPDAYHITEGAGSMWSKGSSDLFFRADGEIAKFTGVKIDGAAIDAKNYASASGSTVITVKASYLETLSAGQHTLTAVFTDGEASTTFQVAQTGGGTTVTASPTPTSGGGTRSTSGTTATASPSPVPGGQSNGQSGGNTGRTAPQTGDETSVVLWVAALLLCGAGAVALGKKKHM